VRILGRLVEARIENVLALRGDPPQGQSTFTPPEGGFRYAAELVELITEKSFGFCTGCAGYPEGHMETARATPNLIHLKRKSTRVATSSSPQLFFDKRLLLRFRRARPAGRDQRADRAGHHAHHQSRTGSALRTPVCATYPWRLELELERAKGNPEAVMQLGVAHATVQCMELLARGVPASISSR